jgi:hypothetical protein
MPAIVITIAVDHPEFKRRLGDMEPETPAEEADRMEIHWPTARQSVAQGLRQLAEEMEQGYYVGRFAVEDEDGLLLVGDVDER